MWNARLEEAQTGIKTAGRNINNLSYTDDTTLMAENEEELKSFLMKKIEIYLWKPNNFIYLDSTQDGKEIKPVNPKGNESWISIGKTDAEAETPILWPFDVKNWLTGKDPDAGKD